MFSTLKKSCSQLTNSCLLGGHEGSLLWIDILSFLLPIGIFSRCLLGVSTVNNVRETQTQQALSEGRLRLIMCNCAPQTQKVLFFRSYGPQTRAPCVNTGVPQAQKAACFALCLISNILSLACSLALLLSLWPFLAPSLSLVRSPFLSLPLACVILLLALVRSVLVSLSPSLLLSLSPSLASPQPPLPALSCACALSLSLPPPLVRGV